MLNSNVRKIIVSMSSFSARASSLVERLGIEATASGEVTPELTTLMEEVKELRATVRELEQELEELGDAEFTDEEHEAFTSDLTNNLMVQNYAAIIEFYNKSFFKPMPRNVRLIIAQVLCNVCLKRKLEPQPLWNSVIANNGNLA